MLRELVASTALTQRTPSRDEVIKAGIPLVRRIAFRFARRLPPHVCVDDLVGAGTEGLLRAAEAYDRSRELQFVAYAEQRIRGAILDELRAADSMTSYGRRRMTDVTRTIRRLEAQLGRAPEEQEIADALALSLEAYQKLAEGLASAPALAGLGGVDPDHVPTTNNDPAEALDDRTLRASLVQAISKLPERSQTVLALYYQEECTQAEIGKILGVTESRVCQVLGDAVARLRATLEREEE